MNIYIYIYIYIHYMNIYIYIYIYIHYIMPHQLELQMILVDLLVDNQAVNIFDFSKMSLVFNILLKFLLCLYITKTKKK